MLISLHIENFALVDHLDLQLPAGLNVLTGETGAGKSIILDALDLALGGKVSEQSLRTGTTKGRIDATFSLTPSLKRWLVDHQLTKTDSDDSFVCSRELTAGKVSAGKVSAGKGTARKVSVRNRSRINGIAVNKQQLESLRDRLVEITAQGQTVQLGQANIQRNWLDGLGGDALAQRKQAVATAYEVCQQAKQRLDKRREREQQRQEQLDLFEFQAKELRQASLSDPDELHQLEQDRNRLSHAVELKQQSYEVYQALYQNDTGGMAAADLLGNAQQILSDMVTYDDQIQPMLDLVGDALAQVEEAGRAINAYGGNLETDPQQLQAIESRIMQLKQICRKYGPTLAEAIAYDQQLQSDLDELGDGGQSIEALEAAYEEAQGILSNRCAVLTELRQATAQTLETALVNELKPLAMDKVQFHVQITPIPPTAAGSDRITFMFSPNPGEPLQPLIKVASGGEMSRFLLALKTCLAQADSSETDAVTMIFDEIDAGVSGRVTQAIAEKLYQLGSQPQVLCVTHQPLVAAMADTHFRVNKTIIQEQSADADATERTVVRVTPLTGDQRKHELAQLAGGKSDEDAIAFAESLLVQADAVRRQLADGSPSPDSLHPD